MNFEIKGAPSAQHNEQMKSHIVYIIVKFQNTGDKKNLYSFDGDRDGDEFKGGDKNSIKFLYNTERNGVRQCRGKINFCLQF